MKYLSVFAILILCLNSCKKDEKSVENSLKQDSTKLNHILKNDSLENSNQVLKIEPLNIAPAKGKTVFSQDKKVMFYFDTQSNTGEININGRSYALDMLNFTDNEYHISGNGVKITAKEGDFKEMTGDCLYGNFPSVKIELDEEEVILKNIFVQDCPAY